MPNDLEKPKIVNSDMPDTALGFVFAMPIESGGVFDKMTERKITKGNGTIFHTGIFAEQQTAMIESGIGSENAGKAAEILLDVFAPKKIISAGFAGGLSKRLKRYNVCFPEMLIRKSDGAMLDVSQPVPQLFYGDLPIENKLALLTADEAVFAPKEKSSLQKETGAELVDMETFAVADVCRKRNVPFLSVRIVLDTAEQEFPKDILRIVQNADKSVFRLTGSVLGSLFRRPSSMLDLWSLKEQTLQAADKLAKHLYREC
ncbi:MAG: hypothetical protein LBN39_00605 [Planctomycetaceae bacterium]|jgi:adenosylhomocysteine nucleosidase|nr:hypothetical protein [Planctomycetaceae bacterium]